MFYKKRLTYFLSFAIILFALTFTLTAADSPYMEYEIPTSENNNSYLSPLIEEVNNVETENVNDVIEIISSCAFDKDTVMSKGSKEIAEIAARIDEFNYWQDAEIIDFKWLHSFETGYITHALFELLGKNGQYGHMVYDCEDESSNSFAACESPYAMAEKKLNTNSSVIISSDDDIYYFYTGISYGCGKVNEKGLMDIYNIHSLLLEDNSQEIEALYDVSFYQSKTEKENVIRERTIVGKEESIREYELRRSELNTSKEP